MAIEKKIILTRGIQGSGKSTWALKWVTEKPSERIRINWDSLRNMFGEYWVPERENTGIISKMTDAFLETSMKNGFDIVVDNMNLNPSSWKYVEDKISAYNKQGNQYHYVMEFKDFFNVTLDECIRRDSMREKPIGESVIRSCYKKYRTFIATEQNKAYVNNLKKQDPGKKNCILVDIDATLCFNLSGRPFYGIINNYNF